MFYRNDTDTLKKIREDILENGRKLRWHEYAEKYGIRNSNGEISGETVRCYIKGVLRDGNCKELDKAKSAGVAVPRGIKEWDTFYGNKRYTVDYKIDQKQEGWQKLFDGLKKDIKKYVKPVADFHVGKKKSDKCAIINLFDAHINKLCLVTETGKQSDINKNIQIFERTFDELLEICKQHNPELIIFPIGNDFYHTNDNTNTTMKGTPQDTMVKSEEEFMMGVKTYRRCLDKACKVAKVWAPVIQSNHSYEKDFYLGQVLGNVYENNKNIKIDNSRRSRKYYRYGKNLWAFCHGDKEHNKIDRLPVIMAQERPHDWAATKYREFLMGDRHHKMEYKFLRVKDMVGVTIRFLRSISDNDRWHVEQSYIGVPKSAELYIYDKDAGMACNYIRNIQ